MKHDRHPPSRFSAALAAALASAWISLAANAQVAIERVKSVSAPANAALATSGPGAGQDEELLDEAPPRPGPQAALPPKGRVVAPAPDPTARRPAKGAVPTPPAGGSTTPASEGRGGPGASTSERIDRVIFDRKPVRVALAVGRERMISFPGAVALHAPEDAEGMLRLQIVGRTLYATAMAAFGTMRVIAEDLERDGTQILVDLVADRSTSTAQGEVEIVHAAALRAAGRTSGAAQAGGDAPGAVPGGESDMVALTRHAARSIYAPRRLVPTSTSIRQVPVANDPVLGLYRGARVHAAPLGAWRSGSLYVTAVRIANDERSPLELDLSEVRGHWLAATAQHGRLGAAGSESDNTTLYLVCDRPFEACR